MSLAFKIDVPEIWKGDRQLSYIPKNTPKKINYKNRFVSIV